MRTLAIDTSSDAGSLALLEDGALLEEIAMEPAAGFGPVIFDQIRSALQRHGWALESVDAFAAGSGPGSFTGVRVGLAAVKGLAEALGRPAFGISNLQALAIFAQKPLRVALIDARRNEAYSGVYDGESNPIGEERVGPIGDAFQWDTALEFEVVCHDASVFAPVLPSGIICREVEHLASAIAGIAYQKLRRSEPGDPAAVVANYVRRSDAELLWRDPHA